MMDRFGHPSPGGDQKQRLGETGVSLATSGLLRSGWWGRLLRIPRRRRLHDLRWDFSCGLYAYRVFLEAIYPNATPIRQSTPAIQGTTSILFGEKIPNNTTTPRQMPPITAARPIKVE
jgi:hypothetical protein